MAIPPLTAPKPSTDIPYPLYSKPKKKKKRKPPVIPVDHSPGFDKSINFLHIWEGGYVNHPSDRGGETKFGISKRSYPHLNIKKLTRKQAVGIYKRDYWDKVRGDELPEDVARVVFDSAVNNGSSIAVKHLQLEIGAKADGIIGPRTMKKLGTYLQENSSHDLSMKLLDKRRWLYRRIIGRDSSQKVFFKNWMDRVNTLEGEIKDEENARRNDVIRKIGEKALLA